MALTKLITVEVAYASTTEQRILTVQVQERASIQAVILQSGIIKLFPEIDLEKQTVGIFSQPKNLGDPVKEGDRIEIYRPLLIDPKEARRAKALKK